ncbi:MAG: response regulator [Nitrospirota bacterium]
MGYKLLLADDSITIQKVVELILAEEGFTIKSTTTGQEALAAIPSFKPDIVLADIEMPKINGYQLCEKIKQDPSMHDIPVILLGGAFEPIDEELAKKVKANDFIIKPFESQELISKINAVLTVLPQEEEKKIEEVAAAKPVVPEKLQVSEEISIEDDLWTMEEIPEIAESEELKEEGVVSETQEKFIETAEEPEIETEAAETKEVFPPISEKVAVEEKVTVPRAEIPSIETPSKEELKHIFKNTINENISSLLSSLNLKEAILASLTPLIKDAVEKVLWEVTPDLAERMLKEMLKGSLESLSKEVEKVIWETVPDLAETIITKEIERIRSEF